MADVWKSQPRKYCEVCKCWLADNKVSREFHEEGTRHKAAVQKKISELHFKENEKVKAEKDLKANMELMNAAAYQGMLKDIARDPKKISVYGVEMNEQTKNEIKKELFNNASIHLAAQSPAPTEQKKCPWRSARTKEGLQYYWNIHTKQSIWDKPADFVEADPATDGQKKHKSSSAATNADKKRNSNQEAAPATAVKKSRIVFNNIKRDTPKPDGEEAPLKDLKDLKSD